MDLQAAETDHLRDPRDQISYKKTKWKCPCNGCAKAMKFERERIASMIQKQHILSTLGQERNYGLRMAECKLGLCDCLSLIHI